MEIQVYEDQPAEVLLPLLEDLFRRLPETRRRTPFDLACLLWSLGYVESLVPECEIEVAMRLLKALEAPARQPTIGAR